MSANLYWEPEVRGHEVTTSAPSEFIESLEDLVGRVPCVLNDVHAPALLALAKVAPRSNNLGYRELADAIATHGSIRVWAVPKKPDRRVTLWHRAAAEACQIGTPSAPTTPPEPENGPEKRPAN